MGTMQSDDVPCFADTLVDILPDARLIAELWDRNIETANLGASWDKTCSSFQGECPPEREKREAQTPCVTIGKHCTEDQCCKLKKAAAGERIDKEMDAKGDRIIEAKEGNKNKYGENAEEQQGYKKVGTSKKTQHKKNTERKNKNNDAKGDRM